MPSTMSPRARPIHVLATRPAPTIVRAIAATTPKSTVAQPAAAISQVRPTRIRSAHQVMAVTGPRGGFTRRARGAGAAGATGGGATGTVIVAVVEVVGGGSGARDDAARDDAGGG